MLTIRCSWDRGAYEEAYRAMMANFLLRPATAADAAAAWVVRCQAIAYGCRDHYPAELLAQWLAAPMPVSFPAKLEALSFVIAESNNSLVSFAGLNPCRAEIDAAFIAPAFAGQGLGRRMLDHLQTIAMDLRLAGLSLKASRNAVAFYLSAGYHVTDEGTHVSSTGLRIPCVNMAKNLAATS